MLHFFGYDHELSKKDEEEMQKQEAKIFEGIISDKKIKGVV
jgi:ssRNA-specific RNase YbeY (16S rRNA maturation enzyme)